MICVQALFRPTARFPVTVPGRRSINVKARLPDMNQSNN